MHGKRILLFALAISAMLFAQGCAQKPWDEGVTAFDPTTFTNAQMLEDYDYIWSTLEENCPLLPVFERAKQTSLVEIKTKHRQKIEQLKDGDVKGFADAIGYVFKAEFRGFGHIFAVSELGFYNVMNNSDVANADIVRMYDNAESKAIYKLLYQDPQIQEYLKQTTGKQEEAVSNSDDTAESFAAEHVLETVKENAAIIKVDTFTAPQDEAMIKRIAQICKENLERENIIIDLRGNSGGSDLIWQKGFAPLFAGKKLETTTIAGYVNTANNQENWHGSLSDNKSVTEYSIGDIKKIEGISSHNVNTEDMKNVDTVAISKSVLDYTGGANRSKKTFDGKLWILTNQQNFSAAESFIRTAKQNNITLVGERTKGNGGELGNMPYNFFKLPNSGILIQYVPFYIFNSDGTCNAEFGTTPDIEISDGKDALEVCLAEIAKGK